MGDKSPKAVNKHATQKQTKTNSVVQKKQSGRRRKASGRQKEVSLGALNLHAGKEARVTFCLA